MNQPLENRVVYTESEEVKKEIDMRLNREFYVSLIRDLLGRGYKIADTYGNLLENPEENVRENDSNYLNHLEIGILKPLKETIKQKGLFGLIEKTVQKQLYLGILTLNYSGEVHENGEFVVKRFYDYKTNWNFKAYGKLNVPEITQLMNELASKYRVTVGVVLKKEKPEERWLKIK